MCKGDIFINKKNFEKYKDEKLTQSETKKEKNKNDMIFVIREPEIRSKHTDILHSIRMIDGGAIPPTDKHNHHYVKMGKLLDGITTGWPNYIPAREIHCITCEETFNTSTQFDDYFQSVGKQTTP